MKSHVLLWVRNVLHCFLNIALTGLSTAKGETILQVVFYDGVPDIAHPIINPFHVILAASDVVVWSALKDDLTHV